MPNGWCRWVAARARRLCAADSGRGLQVFRRDCRRDEPADLHLPQSQHDPFQLLAPAALLFRPALVEQLYGIQPIGDLAVLILHRGSVSSYHFALWLCGDRTHRPSSGGTRHRGQRDELPRALCACWHADRRTAQHRDAKPEPVFSARTGVTPAVPRRDGTNGEDREGNGKGTFPNALDVLAPPPPPERPGKSRSRRCEPPPKPCVASPASNRSSAACPASSLGSKPGLKRRGRAALGRERVQAIGNGSASSTPAEHCTPETVRTVRNVRWRGSGGRGGRDGRLDQECAVTLPTS